MVILKPITPSSALSFKEVRLHALLDTPWAFGSTHAKELLFSDAEWKARAAQWNSDRSTGHLAWDGDNPCGIVASFLDQTDPKKAHLVSMWVAPTHRRLGVGQMLVNQVLAWARSQQVETLHLMVTSRNDAATRFYEKLNFVKTGNTKPYPNDPALIEFEMIHPIQIQ
jgi:ribosomal protein S18 acetylase RimI-like enzyme